MIDVPLLDHGYLKVVETWGSDARIIEAARMSTDKGFLGWEREVSLTCSECEYNLTTTHPLSDHDYTCPVSSSHGRMDQKVNREGDEKLLAYLYNHKHMTPFEMAGMTIEVQAPIFVFREWHRHRTQSYNEMSGRYIELPKLCYIPSADRIAFAKQSGKNKQSSEGFGHALELVQATVTSSFKNVYEVAWANYQEMLELGVARELAARVLPTSQYSRMRASANLRNWLAFLTLRMDPAAQWEIRQYANAVSDLIQSHFPRTHTLFRA